MEIYYKGEKYILVTSNFDETEVIPKSDCESIVVVLYCDFTYDIIEGPYELLLDTYSSILSGIRSNNMICGVALYSREDCCRR